MAQKGGFLKLIISLIIIAAAGFAVIYFFFPDISEQYLNMSWEARGEGASDSVGQALDDVLSGLSEALEDAGASAEDTRRILEETDTGDLASALEKAAEEGRDGIEALADKISSSIDLGKVDMDVFKESISRTISGIDLDAVADQLRVNLEKGISSLGDALKDVMQ